MCVCVCFQSSGGHPQFTPRSWPSCVPTLGIVWCTPNVSPADSSHLVGAAQVPIQGPGEADTSTGTRAWGGGREGGGGQEQAEPPLSSHLGDSGLTLSEGQGQTDGRLTYPNLPWSLRRVPTKVALRGVPSSQLGPLGAGALLSHFGEWGARALRSSRGATEAGPVVGAAKAPGTIWSVHLDAMALGKTQEKFPTNIRHYL